ncbi:MAG: hypothetical protein P8Y37_09940, partial [Anaerolineales bacterium]
MKPSIEKLRKFFRLEADRGYDNKAVMGGLANILSSWELEARKDQLPEQLIQAVITRLRDYHRLSEESREVALKGVWQRLTRETGFDLSSGQPQESPSQTTDDQEPPTPQPQPSDEIPDASSEMPVREESPQSQPEQETESPPEKATPDQPAPAPPPDLDFDAPLSTIKGIGIKK